MSLIVGGIRIALMPGERPEIKFTDQGELYSEVNYHVPSYGDGPAVCAALVGMPEPPLFNGAIRRPHAFQFIPGLTCLKCAEASFFGLGKQSVDQETGLPMWEEARVKATYRIPRFSSSAQESQDNDDDMPLYGEETITYSSEVLITDEGTYRWQEDNTPVNQKIGMMITTTERRVTFNSCMIRNMTQFRNLLRATQGRVNGDVFMGAGSGYVLFMGAVKSRNLAWVATRSKIELVFLERSKLWNSAYRPGVTNAETQDSWFPILPPPYDFAVFSDLFDALIIYPTV